MTEYIVSEFHYLKLVFLDCACSSNYPYLSWVDIMPLAEEIRLLEDGIIKQNNLEVITQSSLHVAKVNIPGEKENKSGLIRAEFLEFVIRLAKLKFYDTKLASSMAEAC